MPLIRCARCGLAYDVPGVVAVRLSNSIATCECGEWLSGSKAALLARLMNPDEINEVDLKPYKVAQSGEASASSPPPSPRSATVTRRSIRVIARGANESVDTIFTISAHPLWIGRSACHVTLSEAELSLRHCSIFLRDDDLVVRDAASHMGTFLDGRRITEATISDGTHLLRLGSALVSVEPTSGEGVAVEPVNGEADMRREEAELVHPLPIQANPERAVLICVGGPLSGQEFEIPSGGLVVGREGHVRVPDEYLSRRHFEVGSDGDGTIRVRDLNSRNGTFLNTLPANNAKVNGGDEIRAGANRFRIERR